MATSIDDTPRSLIKLHKKHIRGTAKNAIVKEFTLYICNLTEAVKKGAQINGTRVYVTSKTIKHLYDKRPAVEYDQIVHNLQLFVKYPDSVHINSSAKRGAFVFIKNIDEEKFLVSVEELIDQDGIACLYVATAFKTDDSYINKFPIMWRWKGGKPSS